MAREPCPIRFESRAMPPHNRRPAGRESTPVSRRVAALPKTIDPRQQIEAGGVVALKQKVAADAPNFPRADHNENGRIDCRHSQQTQKTQHKTLFTWPSKGLMSLSSS